MLIFFLVEENLITIGANVRRETGNDVFKTDPQLNEWMQRVRKLGGSPEAEDDERSKRLEEVKAPVVVEGTGLIVLGDRRTAEGATGATGRYSLVACCGLISRTTAVDVALEGFSAKHCFWPAYTNAFLSLLQR